jgi:hypothetical protein
MKAKIAIAVSALLLGTITTANANYYIESPRGITQAEWNASEVYKNFICPSGYGRGEGLDMNYTTTRTDDFWFVSCELIVVTQPNPSYPTDLSNMPTPTEITPVVPDNTAPVISDTATVVVETATTVTPAPAPTSTTITTTETTTATSTSTTFESLYAQIMALLTQILALIAKLNG